MFMEKYFYIMIQKIYLIKFIITYYIQNIKIVLPLSIVKCHSLCIFDSFTPDMLIFYF